MNLFRRVHQARTLLSIFKHQTGRGLHAQSRPVNTQSGLVTVTSAQVQDESAPLEAQSQAIIDTSIAPDNRDKWKPGIFIGRYRRGLIRKLFVLRATIRRLISYIKPDLSEEERREKVRLKEARRYFGFKKKESIRFARALVNRWTQLQFKDSIVEGQKRKLHRVGIDKIAFDEDGRITMLKLRGETMPGGVTFQDLIARETLNECQPSVGHPMQGTLNVEGCIVTIQVGGLLGLPEFVGIDRMWREMPDNLPMLAFPVGIGDNGRNIYQDLDDCPHLLVVGTTKQGKSNFLNAIICTYLYRMTPKQVQFILFDLKRGMEFSFYEKVPHIYNDEVRGIKGIVEHIDQAIPTLQKLMELMEERMDFIRHSGFKSFNDFNLRHHGGNRIPAIVVVIDEWARISTRFGEQANGLISDISNVARAAGIYIILASQYPKADILTTLATINFSVRIAFKMSIGGSTSILGDRSAVDLPCRGRAVFLNYDESIYVQTPRITDSVVRSMVAHAISGKKSIKVAVVDIEEILQYALEKYDGQLDVYKLFEHFRTMKLSKAKLIDMLKSADNQNFDVSGTAYVVRPRYGRLPRRMVLISETQDTQPSPA